MGERAAIKAQMIGHSNVWLPGVVWTGTKSIAALGHTNLSTIWLTEARCELRLMRDQFALSSCSPRPGNRGGQLPSHFHGAVTVCDRGLVLLAVHGGANSNEN